MRNTKHTSRLKITLLIALALSSATMSGQSKGAIIKEEARALKTYPFGDPSRIPILTDNQKIYPYFTFEGYSHEGQPQDWKVVKMENDYVEVYVLPEVGGKVWGAVEKSTGNEFIYRNEVMKFRNIAMRGPWTSGGIEFNFGLIGHTPATATPVDYLLRENSDGSVSCIVGNIDLPSRTHWRVEIRLPANAAYFETRALWYNPTPMHQSYYNWMTGAAAASEDLEFFCPGNQYLGHPGDLHTWPFEFDRKISEYRQNDFGDSKSYHVVGEYNDFFGGYFHDAGFGFGHWSRYDEMPGQKLWLWALSRSGGIWEDLLTDTDGQYIEFQAGRLFNQFSPSEHSRNPITQSVFPPYTSDTWSERWFPVREIGGMSDVSPVAAMHVREEGGLVKVAVNALAAGSGTLEIITGGETVHQKSFSLKPMEVFTTEADLKDDGSYEVIVPEMDLHYYSDPAQRSIDRPFVTPDAAPLSEAQQHYQKGQELLEFRDYREAQRHFEQCLELDAAHQGSLVGLSELSFRQGAYGPGVEYARKALQFDTYNPHANYVAGINYRAEGDWVNALETFGWAARSMEYRSAAYAQMAEINLQRRNWEEAGHYAGRAIDFNRYNINALQALAIVAREKGNAAMAEEVGRQLLQIDPLHHFARIEGFLLKKDETSKKAVTSLIRNELAYQTYLEEAISYHDRGQTDEALAILELAPSHPLTELWKAFLKQDVPALEKILEQAPDFVFPYRRETIEPLEWALEQRPHWKFQYYLALNYWGKDRRKEAAQLLSAAADSPDYAPFYAARAELLRQYSGHNPEDDLRRALALEPGEWRYPHQLIQYFFSQKNYPAALEAAEKARKRFPDHYTIGMDYASALLGEGKYSAAIDMLNSLQVLPFEGASEGRRLYERAHLGRALEQIGEKKYGDAVATLEASREWPERLGVGKPYDVEERPQDYLSAFCYLNLGQGETAKGFQDQVLHYTREHRDDDDFYHYLGLKLMKEEEARQLIADWKAKREEMSPAMQWVIAKYQGDESTLAVLEQSPEYQDLFQGMDFKLLEQVTGL